jgi:phosphatidylglycerol lysyltransferase
VSDTQDPTPQSDPDESSADDAAAAPPAPAWRRFLARVPFTVTVVVIMLVVGVATQALWDPVRDRPLFEQIGYGLPALRAGRWWTVVSGAVVALTPLQYVAVTGGFAVLVGWSEWRLGTRGTAIATICGQVVGVLGSALLLAVFAPTGWGWAVRVSDDLDVGFSAGALAAVAAASVVVSPPWRARVRFILGLYAVLAFLYVGLLWDLEHLIGVAFGLALGPVLVGRRPSLRLPRMSRHEWRVVASTLFLVAALIRLALWFLPADGPLGASTADTTVWTVLGGAAISLLLANGLRKGRRRAWVLAVVLTSLSLVLVAVVALIAGFAPDPAEIEFDVANTVPALVVDLLLWAVQLTVLLLGRGAFRGLSPRRAASAADSPDARAEATALLTEIGGTSLSWMGTWEENSWFFVRDAHQRASAYIAYQPHRGVGVGLGDPVAPDVATRRRALDAFVDQQETLGQRFCLFSVTQEVADWATDRGFRHVEVAEEAVIDLEKLEFKGKSWQPVRSALNRAAKEGVTYREGRLADMPRSVLAQVRAISEVWVSDKGLPEMGFTLGTVDDALDPHTMVGLAVDDDGKVHGVTSWLPVYAPGGGVRGWTLDVMRRLPDGFKLVTEFLIASACLSFRESGAEFVSLSGAPLAHTGDVSDPDALTRLLDLLGETLEPVYGFRSLESFKAKFSPRNEPLYLVFRDEAALPRIGVALTEAYLPGTPFTAIAVAGLQAFRDA